MCSKFGLVFSGINTEDVKNDKLKNTFEPRRYEVKRNGENANYIELHGLNPMPNIIRIIKTKMMFCKCSTKGEMKSK
jgi:hypothetical protein